MMASTLEAIRRGDAETLRGLLQEHPELAHGRDVQGVSMVMHSLYHRQEELTEILLEARRAEPAGKEEGEGLDLFEAAALGRAERVAEILAADPAQISATAPDGFSALHLAAFFAREEAVRRLLALGAPVAATTAANPTAVQPLHSAVAGGSAEVVRHLLAAGADPDARQQMGFTPLMGAAGGGHREMVEALLAAGADPALVSDDGRTAADLARERGHEELAGLL